jgi:hypothetical protein
MAYYDKVVVQTNMSLDLHMPLRIIQIVGKNI